jgi:hypothetical protein
VFVTSLFFGQEIQDLAGKFRNKLLEGSSSQDATEQQIEALTKVAHVVTHTHTHSSLTGSFLVQVEYLKPSIGKLFEAKYPVRATWVQESNGEYICPVCHCSGDQKCDGVQGHCPVSFKFSQKNHLVECQEVWGLGSRV